MSLFSSLNISLSGLQAISTQMQVTANNIANATTEGYTRKTAVTQAVTLGGEGGGTQIVGFSRASDSALATTLNLALSDYGLRSTQNDYLQQVENLLGCTDSTDPALSTAISDFAAAWRQLESAPEDNVCQREVTQAASNLVSTIQTIAASIESLDQQCANDINNTLTDLNSTLNSIVDLNKKISLGISAGTDVGNLQDERDLLVQSIAEDMNVTVMERDQGQIALYTTGGYMLVDGEAQSFRYDGTNIYADGDPTHSLNYSLTGGSIQALVNFRATSTPASLDPATNVIQKLESQIDEIVSAFTDVSLGPPASFACAYNGVAMASVTNGITFSSVYSGSFGNGVSVAIADTGGGTYSATISIAGQDDEVYTGLTTTGGFWNNLASAINDGGGVPASPASRLITAAVSGTGASTSYVGTHTLSGGLGDVTNGVASANVYSNGVASLTQQSNCISYFARASGADGNSISIQIVDGTGGPGSGLYTATITDSSAVPPVVETYTDISDGGGGNAFWVNLASAINSGGGVPAQPASTLITATAGVGVAVPDALVHTLTGGGTGGSTCLSLASLDAGTDGNNISATLSQGTSAGTYKVTIKVSGIVVETYDNINNSGSGLWRNIADAINATSTRVMATAGTATMLPATGSTTNLTFEGGTSELLTGFFTGTDASTLAVNANLLNGTQTIKLVSSEAIGDAFNSSARSFTADGLSISGASYESLAASILTGFQQSATNIASLNSTSESQKEYLVQRITNETAVNVDSETVFLTTLQNSYAASAHVISVINELFDILEAI